MERRTVAALLVGLVLGLVLGAAGVSTFTPTDRIATPSSSIATATGCTDEPIGSGWIGQYGSGDAAVVAVKFVLTHESPAINHTADIEELAAGAYRLTLATELDAAARKGDPPADCQPRTEVTASVGLPSDYDSIEVVVDDTSLVRIEARQGSFPSFRPFNGTVAVN